MRVLKGLWGWGNSFFIGYFLNVIYNYFTNGVLREYNIILMFVLLFICIIKNCIDFLKMIYTE